MTQEQKAQTYDKALREAELLYHSSVSVGIKQWLKNTFPEIKEESIPKKLYNLLYGEITTRQFEKYGLTVDEALNWFEKQKKPIVPLDENGEPVLTDFEGELFSVISSFWQSYNLGEEINIASFVKEVAPDLLKEATKEVSLKKEKIDNADNIDVEQMVYEYKNTEEYEQENNYLRNQ